MALCISVVLDSSLFLPRTCGVNYWLICCRRNLGVEEDLKEDLREDTSRRIKEKCPDKWKLDKDKNPNHVRLLNSKIIILKTDNPSSRYVNTLIKLTSNILYEWANL